ncbi:MAG: leucine-rich repeat domain-containing protein, partial [Oscillospiraceae bacterium]|nr:leucine-rich repeat domain-containing protein [Oscillospiraceae bacterium]
MKGKIKKTLVLMLTFTVLLSAAPLSGFVGIDPTGLFAFRASAVEETEETISGTVGTKLSWSIDKASGVLTIDNTGDMISFASDDAPWKQYSDYITSAIISEGCTSISKNAFVDCSEMVSVTLPNSLTSIGNSAFSNCTSLVNITIPDSVTIIGEGAFSNCTSLDGIEIPNSVTSIADNAFSNCSNLSSINIPDSATSIGNYAFSNCTSLGSIEIPNSVTNIGYSAFFGCSKISKLNLPSGLKEIGDYAFKDLSLITELVVPDGVTQIGRGAFKGMTALENITLPFVGKSENANGTSGVFGFIFDYTYYNENGTTYQGDYYHYIPKSLRKVTITADTTISDYAFYGCSFLTKIDIPETVQSIGSYAFNGCKNLTAVDIPFNCKCINNNAFSNCTNLSKITIYSKDCSIDETAISIYSTIYGFSGSTAETFANQYGYEFVSIDDSHEHEYSNACDNVCNLCGEKRDTAHSFGNWKTVKESS